MIAIEPMSKRADGGISAMRCPMFEMNDRSLSTTLMASMPSVVVVVNGELRRLSS